MANKLVREYVWNRKFSFRNNDDFDPFTAEFILSAWFASASLTVSIVLFGDQAVYPHGSKFGKALEAGEFVAIDIRSTLHAYGSDVTRTILPDGAAVSEELMDTWGTVHAAQEAGFGYMHANETCVDVDASSRVPIEDAGYGAFYTHRLSHGLGLGMHEHPYLNGVKKEKLKLGEVATNEPGIT
ncbi:hypothetical protein DL763_000469 [Monosporascus cannonballus]|nr:hypothetical protein DL763_000469 [Monosporascus cannonballus]